MRQIFLLILAVILLIVGFGLLNKNASKTKSDNLNLRSVIIADTKINVSLADTPQKRGLGLSGRKELSQNEGMLFVFESQNQTSPFWMKDMLIPIDIIWINDGKVVGIEKNLPLEPGVEDKNLKLYFPPTLVDYVLEVNAGFSDKNKIKIGDPFSLSE